MAKLLPVPKNENYAAIVTTIRAINVLDNCDNVVGVPVFGYQAIMGKDVNVGDKILVFVAETQLSPEFLSNNNLYRDSEKNVNKEKSGYFGDNGRVRAVRFRKQRSDAFAIKLSSLEFTGYNIDSLNDGDTFDTLNGINICQKYVVNVRQNNGNKKDKKEKFKPRVDVKFFPEHFDTLHWLRKSDHISDDAVLIVTDKLHGCSGRIGRIPVKRNLKWYEKILQKFGVKIQTTEYDYMYGSRRVIKDPEYPYNKDDVWFRVGDRIKDIIPDNFIVYGELVGWDNNTPIMKNYTYNVPDGTTAFYVYRITVMTNSGRVVELPWDHVRQFCVNNGLNHVPELFRVTKREALVTGILNELMDKRFYDERDKFMFKDVPLPLSDKKTVDEGICIRVENGFNTEIFKYKSPKFLEHETKMLDGGEESLEDNQSE